MRNPATNQQEFITLIEEHGGIINKIVGLYTDTRADSEDLRQEILLQSWKSIKNFGGRSAFSTWLYKVALNTALKYRKKKKLKAESISETAREQVKTDSSESYEILYGIIKSLNEVDKMLMTLHMDGYKNPEIADITGMSTNHVNVKLHRIKKTVIDKYKKLNP